jgi:hypothetical protein
LKPIPSVAASQDLAPILVPSKEEDRAVVPNVNPTHAVTPNQDAVRRFVSEEDRIQTQAPDLDQIQTVATVRDSPLSFVPSQNRTSIFESNENLVEPLPSGPKSILAVAPSQNSPRIIAPSQSPPELTEQGQSLIQTFAASRDSSQTFTQNHDETAVRPEKPGMDGVPASIDRSGLEQLPVAVSAASVVSAPVSMPADGAAPVIAGKSSSIGGGGTTTPGASKSVRGVDRFSPAQHGSRLVEGQPSGLSVEASAVAAGVAGVRGAASLAGEFTGGSAASIAGPELRETFEALDSEGSLGKPAWIHAGAQRAEAGFEDPALGWVGVRAESGGGRVHAEVVPGSADAAQALSGHLAGLNAFLAEHHTPVETLTLTAPESRWAGPGSERDAGQNLQQGTGQQAGQQTPQSIERVFQAVPSGSSPVVSAGTSEQSAIDGGPDGSGETEGRAGIHISVMA